jgi:hypothetical protein
VEQDNMDFQVEHGNEKIIDNNFIVIGMGFGLWSIITIIIFYIFFFAGIIDWNQNISIFEIIKQENQKNVRFIFAIFLWVLSTIMALVSFLNLKKEPKYFTYLDSDKFLHTPFSMEQSKINHSDVLYIKKSFFPLYGKSPRGFKPAHLLLIFAIPIIQSIFLVMYFFKVCCWMWNTIILGKDSRFMIFSYIIVFKNESELININLLNNKDYTILDEYLYKYFNKNIEDLDINFTLVRQEGK